MVVSQYYRPCRLRYLLCFQVLVFGSAESGAAFGNALVIPRDLPAWSEGAAEGFRNVHIECDSLLLMPFSSGTGGKPRCVKLTHRNYSAATAILKMYGGQLQSNQ